MKKLLLAVLFLHSIFVAAQPIGNIRGLITDGASGRRLQSVTVFVLNSNPNIETTTDSDGYFSLNSLPLGRYTIQTRCDGYDPVVYRDILIASRKDIFLEIILQESVRSSIPFGDDWGGVRMQSNSENQMALTSSRMFSVEETSRYAGGLDDPARFVTAFAGVSGSMRSNRIAIRGNAPQTLQWRIEGIETVNPSHFTDIAGAGGGIISALSSQVLGNSGFFTGAFPAEYGNALSGVFDLQLRTGNNQRREHSAQIGLMGAEIATEGPFAVGAGANPASTQQASYLFSYRYFDLAMIGDIFPDMIGDAAKMSFQNMSFKMNFPTVKAGTFSVWGIGMSDHFKQRPKKNQDNWINIFEKESDFQQYKAIGGIGHQINTGKKSYLKSALAVNYVQNDIVIEQVYKDGNKIEVADMKNANWNIAFNTFVNTKFNASHTNRTGINLTGLFFDLDYSVSPNINFNVPGDMVNYAKGVGNSALFSIFSQSSFRLNNRTTANVGLLGLYFHLNNKSTIEPRVGIRWQALDKHSFGFAYGKHSKRESIDYYFVETTPNEGIYANKYLNFSKSHHLVAAYGWDISKHIKLIVEPYYQYLYDIPVMKDSLSLINHTDFFLMLPLVNGAKGENYGIDVTLEHQMNKGYYFMLTASVFDSRSTGGDGKWQNTRVNRNHIFNILGGKEWQIGKHSQNLLSVGVRFTVQGGERYIPINETESNIHKIIIYDHSQAYTEQLPTEFITHLTTGYKINSNRFSHEISLKLINITGTKEFEKHTYNYHTNSSEMYMKAGMIPNISYKIEF